MRKAWLIMVTVYLASIAITINQFKVPPVMKIILQDLNLTMTQGGWLMSTFSVASIFLAIPTVLIIGRYGPKITGVIALSCVMIGSLLGGFAQNTEFFFLTRMFEGVGMGLMAIIAPSVIAAWFPLEKRALPMGIWATWVPVGFFVSYNIAIPISDNYGWQGLWWIGAFVTFIALLFYVLLVNNPKSIEIQGQELKPVKISNFKEGLKTPAPWLLGIGFGGLGFANSGFLTFAPQYYSEFHGIEISIANFLVSIPFMISIFSNPFSGWVISNYHKTKFIHILSICLIVIMFSIVYFLPSAKWIIPWAITLGFLLGFFATGNFTLASSSINSSEPSPMLISLGLGINNMVYQTGFLLGPPALGSIISGGNWDLGVWPAVSSTLISVLACVLFFNKISRKEKERKSLDLNEAIFPAKLGN